MSENNNVFRPNYFLLLNNAFLLSRHVLKIMG